MGFLKDIQDMPNQYDYSLQFYNRFYRPEHSTITLVGDVTHDHALALTKKYFGEWKSGNYRPDIPLEPAQKESRQASVAWAAPTLPWIAVAFKGPAYSDEKKDKAALDLLSPMAFGSNSDLYQRLVLKEQKVDELEVAFGNHPDPELFTIWARIKDPKDIDYVRYQILATFERFTKETVDPGRLEATRSRIRYSFPSSQRRGGAKRRGAQAGRDISPIRPPRRLRFAQRSFSSGFALTGSRFAPSSARRGIIIFGLVLLLWCTALTAFPSKIPTVLLPGPSPLVTFRILFMTGSAFDPPGKEGLAALTASML